VTLTLAGAGPLEDELDARIAALGLADRWRASTVVETVAAQTPVLVARSEGPAETLAGERGGRGPAGHRLPRRCRHRHARPAGAPAHHPRPVRPPGPAPAADSVTNPTIRYDPVPYR
jgi:hypothetical protein